jgi:hypothetical protein
VTVRDLITNSLRLIGAIATGETPSASELADGIVVLNDMLGSWSTDGLIIPQTVIEEFPLVPGKQSYTMGATGDFVSTRPMRIMEAGIKSNTSELPIEVIGVQEWSQITVKSNSSWLPQRLYADGSFPNQVINLWPIPSAPNTLVLYSLKGFTEFATATDVIAFPPGYTRCLRYNLALELAVEYGKEPSPLVAAVAVDSKADLRRQNNQPVLMISDYFGLSGGRTFNWQTGE